MLSFLFLVKNFSVNRVSKNLSLGSRGSEGQRALSGTFWEALTGAFSESHSHWIQKVLCPYIFEINLLFLIYVKRWRPSVNSLWMKITQRSMRAPTSLSILVIIWSEKVSYGSYVQTQEKEINKKTLVHVYRGKIFLSGFTLCRSYLLHTK